uniref:IQ motif and ubiquitin-like domain-containing protein n=1 Tax=Trypanosoma vivax (strain Y486) TaxID=1055687 RepID=G0TY84_TRYVY|nr:conserved hypothetical protein [Trypanosoma vivax Y486]
MCLSVLLIDLLRSFHTFHNFFLSVIKQLHTVIIAGKVKFFQIKMQEGGSESPFDQFSSSSAQRTQRRGAQDDPEGTTNEIAQGHAGESGVPGKSLQSIELHGEQTEVPGSLEASDHVERGEIDEAPRSLMVGADVSQAVNAWKEKEELPITDAATLVIGTGVPEPELPSCGVQAGDGDDCTAPQPSQMQAQFVPQLRPEKYIVEADVSVTVYATVYPMAFSTTVRCPGCSKGVIHTRLLYETLAARFGVHPEIILLFCRGERLRFGATTSYVQGSSSSEGCIWVDVHFKGDSVPEHLRNVLKGESFVRCLRTRARLEPICPADLIAARQRGLTFGEAIQEVHERTKPENTVLVTVINDPNGTAHPFLGGYRLKADHSRVFYHAATQLSSPGDVTLSKLQYGPVAVSRASRKTQTYGVSRSCQTLREGRTQTQRPDYEVDDRFDEIVIAKPYFSSRELHTLQCKVIVVIQKMYRKWKARKVYRELAEARQAVLDKAAMQAAEEEAEKCRREEFELRRRVVPKTADDFDTLRRELEAWRAGEAERITTDKSLNEDQKRTALTDLTKKEVKLLMELETLRVDVMKDRRTRRFQNVLQAMTLAKECGSVSVITQAAERARELRELYISLSETPKTVEGRLDTLLHVKWTVKEFDVPLCRDIVELIDREADLLQRGRTACSLKGLRMRIENLFKRFIATPEYNPAVDEVVKGTRFGVVVDGDAAKVVVSSRRIKPANVL